MKAWSNVYVGFLFLQFSQTQKMWSYVQMEGVTTCSCTTVCGLQCTGKRSQQRSDAALGSTKGIRIVALFHTLRSSVTSWRFVSLLHFTRHKCCFSKMWDNILLFFIQFCIDLNVQFLHCKSVFILKQSVSDLRQNIRKLCLPTSGTVDWSSRQEKLLSCTIQR